MEAGRTHRWPYLVRHLASHLTAGERPGVIAGLLGEFAWLEGLLRLASQLLARLADDGGPVEKQLRAQAKHWLRQAGGATTLGASLVAHGALLRTLPVGSGVNALVALRDGRLASDSADNTIRLWDPHTGSCERPRSEAGRDL